MKRSLRTAAALAAVPALALAGCGSSDDAASTSTTVAGGTTTSAAAATTTIAEKPVVIGSNSFTESELLAYIYGGALEKAGTKVTYKTKVGSREVSQPAIEKGDFDLIPEYVGNYLGFVDKTATKGVPIEQATSLLKAAIAPKGLSIGAVSTAADGDVIAVTKAFATENNLTSISDLKKVTKPLTLAGPSECETRETCLLGLKSTYGLTVSFSSTAKDAGGTVTKAALDQGKANIARLFSTDTDTLPGGKYVVLKDDLGYQQAGNILPVFRTSSISTSQLAVLDKVSRTLTTEKLIALDKKTDVDKEDAKAVADGFLKAEGLA